MGGDPSPVGYFGQTYAIEFTVEGDLDGTTVSPTIDNSPPTGIGNADPQQLYRRTIPNLGLIDPDYTPAQDEDDRRGARGNRLVTFLWIEGSTPGAVGASVDVVDAIDGVTVQQNLGSLAGVTTFYRRGIFIPQGSMIRVSGLSGDAASPVKVRFHVQFLDNAENIADVLNAVCCLEDSESRLELVAQNEGLAAVFTAAVVFTPALTLGPLDLPSGLYRVGFSCGIVSSLLTAPPELLLSVDGANVTPLIYGTFGTALSLATDFPSGFAYVFLGAGSHSFALEHANLTGTGTTATGNRRLELFRMVGG